MMQHQSLHRTAIYLLALHHPLAPSLAMDTSRADRRRCHYLGGRHRSLFSVVVSHRHVTLHVDIRWVIQFGKISREQIE